MTPGKPYSWHGVVPVAPIATPDCPRCGSTVVDYAGKTELSHLDLFVCRKCAYGFTTVRDELHDPRDLRAGVEP